MWFAKSFKKFLNCLRSTNASSKSLETALLGDENKLWDFFLSNDLWGGAGSVADQAFLELPEERKREGYSTN